jgi:hypothetical protein
MIELENTGLKLLGVNHAQRQQRSIKSVCHDYRKFSIAPLLWGAELTEANAFTILDATGPIISVKISGELDRSEVLRYTAAPAAHPTLRERSAPYFAR